ncbi:unnamed protein product [Phaedon cochleariae]|uniref:DUF4806 domain-containing protein n=1 Tax=Phaedon cochleariae TaxID=80249 RepID=A0A9N9SAT4_PHACE|nr:unnamed protein product [Phaedon cochleariae]
MNMNFLGVEFRDSEDGGGGGLAVVHCKWLTPKKKECFWPAIKNQSKYYNILRNGDSPDEKLWTLHKIGRIFFESDNLDKAREKLKQAEFTSDVQSDSELDSQTIKRRRIAPRKLYESESEESETNEEFLDLPRPPQIKSKTSERLKFGQLSQKKTTGSFSFVEKNRVGTPSVDSNRDSMTSTPIVQKSDTNQISGYQQTLRTLEYIKEQNKQILALLNSRGGSFSNQASYNLDNLPVEIPLSSNEDLNILENFLKEDQNLRNLMSYLSSLGGKDHIVQTNNCLRRLLTNEFSCQFSFMGKRGGKKAFSDLLLKKCVIGAVTKNLPQIKERDIEDAIKNWLKHSPQRYHNELLKNRRNTN